MKVINYILIIVSIVLPMIICWKLVDVSKLPEWLWIPATMIPFVAMYAVAMKGKSPEWKGLQNTGVAFYYGTWAVEVAFLTGLLAFVGREWGLIISMSKAGTVLFGLTFLCRIIEWTGLPAKIGKKWLDKLED